MSLLKSLMAAVAAMALPGVAAAAVTFNLTLTDASAPAYSGTGVLTLDFAPAAVGQTDYTAAQVSNLSFFIDGQTFTATPFNLSVVRFMNGQLNDITFAQEIGTSPNRFALHTTSGYVFYYGNELQAAYGTITASPAPGAVPEPASWAMMIVGFGLVGAVLRRRAQATGPSLA
jgi:hypothetical protein